MAELCIGIHHPAGLHARPLAQFVRTAQRFQSNIQVENVTTHKGPRNGKSPLNLMLLAVTDGQEVRIVAEGPDADQAINALRGLITGGFEEEVAA